MELAVDEVRVHRAVSHERRRDEPREHVGDRRLRLPSRSSSTMRSRVATSSVASAVTVSWKTGACPRLGEPARDRLARRRELDDLELRAAAARRGRRADRRPAFSTSSAITRPSGPVPDHREVDATLARDAPRERARLHALAVGARRGLGIRPQALGRRLRDSGSPARWLAALPRLSAAPAFVAPRRASGAAGLCGRVAVPARRASSARTRPRPARR